MKHDADNSSAGMHAHNTTTVVTLGERFAAAAAAVAAEEVTRRAAVEAAEAERGAAWQATLRAISRRRAEDVAVPVKVKPDDEEQRRRATNALANNPGLSLRDVCKAVGVNQSAQSRSKGAVWEVWDACQRAKNRRARTLSGAAAGDDD